MIRPAGLGEYWKLRTDYTIQATIDPTTAILTGRETVVIHNNSAAPMPQIALRLDPNIFRPTNQRGASVPAEATDGMILTALTVNGAAVNLTPPSPGRPAAAPATPRIVGLQQSLAMITPGHAHCPG